MPSIAETVAGYEARTWAGVGVPKGTPSSVIQRLNREIIDGLTNPAIRARLADIGTIPMVLTPDEFGAFIAVETEKWGKVVRSAGIRPE